MYTDAPTRPRWNHSCVKEATAREFVEPVRAWAKDAGIDDGEADDKEFLAVLALALIESPDAYHAGRYLEDFIHWPVNGKLIQILDIAYARMQYVTRDLVHIWVMEHNIRFPAKRGNVVLCKIGEVNITGKIVEIIPREAKGYFIPNGRNKPMPVYAEEIQQVIAQRETKTQSEDDGA